MRQAILTKYIGPTNTRGSRVKAWCEAGSVTIPWDSAKDAKDNGRLAARVLQRKFGWDKYNGLIGGSVPTGYVWIQIERK